MSEPLSGREKAIIAIQYLANLKHPEQSPPQVRNEVFARLLDHFWKKYFPNVSKKETMFLVKEVGASIPQCTAELSRAWEILWPNPQTQPTRPIKIPSQIDTAIQKLNLSGKKILKHQEQLKEVAKAEAGYDITD